MKENWLDELEAQIFDGVDMDDDDALLDALSEFETTAKVIKALEENDSVLTING